MQTDGKVMFQDADECVTGQLPSGAKFAQSTAAKDLDAGLCTALPYLENFDDGVDDSEAAAVFLHADSLFANKLVVRSVAETNRCPVADVPCVGCA